MIYDLEAPAKTPTWGVVTTCREPTPLVIAFVAHYLKLGASRVYLYLDAEQPDVVALLAHLPQVQITICNAAYWGDAMLKRRFKKTEYRQLVNAFHAYQNTDVDWLAHFDADEFLHTDLPVSQILAAQHTQMDYAVVPVRERAFVRETPQENMFDGVFRTPMPHEWEYGTVLFNENEKFLRRGLLGYPHGKSIMRTGLQILPGIHTPRSPAERRQVRLKGWTINRARLLHFDGLTSLHWSAKLLRAAAAGMHYVGSVNKSFESERAEQIAQMYEYDGDLEKAFELHQRLKTIPAANLDQLRTLGLIEDHNLDIAGAVNALKLPEPVSLSRAGFDAALSKQHEQVGGWHGAWEDILKTAETWAFASNDELSVG